MLKSENPNSRNPKSKSRSPSLKRSIASIAVAPLVLLPVGMAVNAQADGQEMLLAQTPEAVPTFQLPGALPAGTTVKVNGSVGLRAANEALKQRFESRFSGTRVELAADGTDAALKALAQGKIDIAAIGRLLTDAERAQGLQQVPVSREKIAIVVGAQNPFKSSLTAEQFAKIFRGEITNWSQVGGPNAPIRLIDRPASSDTRQSLSYYPIFQSAPFRTGANAVQAADDTAAIVKELGANGLGYAPLSQVLNLPGVQILPMHDTLPTDPRYPFSQPRVYVYKGNPNPGVLAFLGFATSVPGQEPIAAAAASQTAPASNSATGAANTTSAGTAPAGTVPANSAPAGTSGGTAAETAAGTAAPTAPAGTDAAGNPAAGTAGTTPADTAPTAQATDPAAAGTASGTASAPLPGSTAENAPSDAAEGFPVWLSRFWWLLLPLLGLLLLWLLRGKGGAVPPVIAATDRQGRLILTPRDCRNAYAYWEIPEAQFAEAHRQGGRDLKVRLYDVTDIADLDQQAAHSMREFDCAEDAQDLHLPVSIDDRDYLAELGYETADNRWIRLARSTPVRVPACTPLGNDRGFATSVGGTAPGVGGLAAAGAAAGFTAGTAARSLADPDRTDDRAADRPEDRTGQPSRLILVPRTPEVAYAYWEVSEARKAELKRRGGEKLLMRIQDVTEVSENGEALPATPRARYFECDEQASDLRLPTQPNRSYVAELGYRTPDNRWLSLVRSTPVQVPPEVQGTFKPVKRPVVEAAAKTEDATQETANLLETVSQQTSNLAGNSTAVMGTAIAGGSAAITGVALGTKSLWDRRSDPTGSAEGILPERIREISPEMAREIPPEISSEISPEVPPVCQIILVARSPKEAYAYWEISDSYKQALRDQGGTRLMLQIHDATNLNIDYETPHSTQEYPCQETDQDRHIPISWSDRDYIAEIGYYTEDDRWLRLIRSLHVRVPAES